MSGSFTTVNPATGATIATCQYMTEAEAAKAVENCHIAFRGWRTRSLDDRGAILKKIGKGLRDNKDALAKLMTQEMGKLLSQSVQEVELRAAICEWTADDAAETLKTEERDLGKDGKGMIFRSPIGVIYGI
jgi:succinate-semialdehyde dehydrogenase / glutarate-semialdehyde dehydrogenase